MQKLLVPFLSIGMACVLVAASFASIDRPESYSDEFLKKEMKISFAEEFSEEFREENYPGMVITYDNEGIPTVYSNELINPHVRAVYAKTGSIFKRPFYSKSNGGKVLFYVPTNSTVKVIDSSHNEEMAKVEYAGTTGYMKTSHLIL